MGMRNFNRGGRREDRPMYQATCTDCGKSCEVPFKPSGNKPVLCRDCFRGGRSDHRSERRDFAEKKMYSVVCDKCGNRCEVPFQPSGDKPVYCRDCFGKGRSNGGKSTEHFDQQFSLLNEKLDRILQRLTPTYLREPKKITKKKLSTKGRKKT